MYPTPVPGIIFCGQIYNIYFSKILFVISTIVYIPTDSKITINLRDIYTAPCVMILRRDIHITWGIAIVVLKVSPVLGPGIALAYLGPKMALGASKSLRTGPYKYQVDS